MTWDMCQTAVKHDDMDIKCGLNKLSEMVKKGVGNNGKRRMTRNMCQTAVKYDGMNRKWGLRREGGPGPKNTC